VNRVLAIRIALVAAVVVALASMPPSGASAARATLGCSPAQTRAVITRFVTAFNAGNRKALNEIWVNKLSFKWYGVTSPPGLRPFAAATERSTLLSYFAQRHAAHERLQLTKVKVNGVTARAYRNFEFDLLRSADDLPYGPALYRGKGAALCSTGRLMVWSMGAVS
jgi:hypothetical protein